MQQVLHPSERIRDVFAALDNKDLTELATHVSEDIRMTMSNADPIEGKPSFVQRAEAFVGSLASIRHEITSLWTVDDVVIAELWVHYGRLDGQQLTLPCCNVFRVRDGLVTDYRVYMDSTPVFA
jgi:ketosteroid isomerase-like protein